MSAPETTPVLAPLLPRLRAERAALRSTEAALPLRSASPLDGMDEETFVRVTRRALSHYGDLSKLVASPLTAERFSSVTVGGK